MKKLLFVLAAVSALSLISCSDDSSSSSTPVSTSVELPASIGTNELKDLTLSDGSSTIIKFDDEKITETFTDKDDGSVSIKILKYTYNSEKKEIYVSYYGIIKDGKEITISELFEQRKKEGLSNQAIEDFKVRVEGYSIITYEKTDNTVNFTSVFDGTLNNMAGGSLGMAYNIFRSNSYNYLEDIVFYDNTISFVDGDYECYLHFTGNTFTGNIYHIYEPIGNLSGSYVLDNEGSSPKLAFTFDSIICNVEEIKFFNGKSVDLNLDRGEDFFTIVNE